MTIYTILVCVALLGAIVLVASHRPLVFPLIALVASSLEALRTFHLIQLNVPHVPLPLVLGGALLVSGVAVHIRALTKGTVTSATAIVLVGALQTFSALHKGG
jgi:hypothetical protein